MRLILVRHGQTDWNLEQRMQGQLDIPLNETGREQAVALGKRLALWAVDRVYVSPLERARETAALALAGRHVPLTVDARLSEIYLGRLQGMTVQKAAPLFPDGDWRYERYGGESLEDLYGRLSSFAEERLPQPGTTLLVMHGMSLRMLRAVLLKLDPQDARIVAPPSCCYCQADFHQGVWRFSSFGDVLHRAPGFGAWYAAAEEKKAFFPAGTLATPFATLAMAMAAQPNRLTYDPMGAFPHDGTAAGVVHTLLKTSGALDPVTHPTLGDGWLWRLRKECPAEPLPSMECGAILKSLGHREVTYDPKTL